MKLQDIQHFPLNRAYYCPDCGTVSNDSKACPACANGAIVLLASMFKESEIEDEQTRFKRAY